MPRIIRVDIISAVAGRTTGWRPCKPAGVTGNTHRLLMCARERKCGRVVVKNIINGTRWVTGKAHWIVVRIPGYPLMCLIGLRVDMTIDTRGCLEISRIIVTIRALCPGIGMCT